MIFRASSYGPATKYGLPSLPSGTRAVLASGVELFHRLDKRCILPPEFGEVPLLLYEQGRHVWQVPGVEVG
jgi:hypothetical protein